MCITFFSIHPNKTYKFMLLFNRDEFLARKTLPLNFHFSKNEIYKDVLFYPLDCAYEGTFLCINIKSGNICCLLNNNFESIPFNPDAKLKRGEIPLKFCQLNEDCSLWEKFFKFLEDNKNDSNGFNLICGNLLTEDYYYYTNNYNEDYDIKVPFRFTQEGLYGVSNSFLTGNTMYNKKVEYGKQNLKEILDSLDGETTEKEFVYKLFSFMGDKTKLNDYDCDGNVTNIFEKNIAKAIFDKRVKNYVCSSLFVDDKLDKFLMEYGTRHTICVLCDYQNNLSVYEYFDQIHHLSCDDCIDVGEKAKLNVNDPLNSLTNINSTYADTNTNKKYFLKERNLENLNEFKFKLNS